MAANEAAAAALLGSLRKSPILFCAVDAAFGFVWQKRGREIGGRPRVALFCNSQVGLEAMGGIWLCSAESQAVIGRTVQLGLFRSSAILHCAVAGKS
jgi:hypothetical protein